LCAYRLTKICYRAVVLLPFRLFVLSNRLRCVLMLQQSVWYSRVTVLTTVFRWLRYDRYDCSENDMMGRSRTSSIQAMCAAVVELTSVLAEDYLGAFRSYDDRCYRRVFVRFMATYYNITLPRQTGLSGVRRVDI